MRFIGFILLVAMIGCTSSPPVIVEVLSANRVVLDDGRKVQYAGLETLAAGHPLFMKCKQANAYLVLNKTVRVIEEPALSTDGQIIAYVYTPILVGQETKYLFVNAELVRFGYAKVLPVPKGCENPQLWQSLFDLQENEAKPSERELWSKEVNP